MESSKYPGDRDVLLVMLSIHL